MGFQMNTWNLGGWTSLSISLTSDRLPAEAGVFVLLLQENSVSRGVSCSQCASLEQVHRLFVTTWPYPLPAGPTTIRGDWLLLCTTCSIGLIDVWRSENRGR